MTVHQAQVVEGVVVVVSVVVMHFYRQGVNLQR
jgi:hypothetical protein